MEQTNNKFSCTLKLLALASLAAYRILENPNSNSNSNSNPYEEEPRLDSGLLEHIKSHGYKIIQALPNKELHKPQDNKRSDQKRVDALTLLPTNPENPIIISYRGTKFRSDYYSNLRIGFFGVVEPKRREEAFKFYQMIRAQYPNREILLTGHSLGGNLALYVGARAYEESIGKTGTADSLLTNHLIQVRTFNAAPISTSHPGFLQRHPEIARLLINYRLEGDLISHIPLQKYHQNNFTFRSQAHTFTAHIMKLVLKYLPQQTLDLVIGRNSSGINTNLVIEYINGILYSYECRVNNQFFSRWRAGIKNFRHMKKIFPDVCKDIQNQDYVTALSKLTNLKKKFHGKVSNKLVSELMDIIIQVSKQGVSIEMKPLSTGANTISI